MSDPAIACKLSEPELRRRRDTVLRGVSRAIQEIVELEDGYAYRFGAEDGRLMSLAEIVSFERECCPFLRWRLSAEPGEGPLWLEARGPAGSKEFLRRLFEDVPAAE